MTQPDPPVIEFGHREFVREGVRGTGGDLGMRARVRPFGATLLVSVAGTGSEFERRPTIADIPSIDVIFVDRGSFAYLDSDGWHRSDAALLIAPSGLPQRVRCEGDWAMTMARVPRAALLPHVPMLVDAVSIHDTLTPLESAMQAYVAEMARTNDEMPAADRASVQRTVLEMTASVVRSRQGDAWALGSPRAVLRDRALMAIARLCTDPTLGPARVAEEVGASLRHLQAVLAEADTSVATEIRRERARVARSMLQDARHDGLTIGQVAEAVGFGSAVSMRRSLEDFYRFGPKELRNARGV